MVSIEICIIERGTGRETGSDTATTDIVTSSEIESVKLTSGNASLNVSSRGTTKGKQCNVV